MRLGDKLRRTLDQAPPPPSAPVSPAQHLREALKQLHPQGRRISTQGFPSFDPPEDVPPSLMELIPGEIAPWASEGEVWLSTQRLPLDSLYARWGPQVLTQSYYSHLSTYVGDARLASFNPSQALYLDVESTGLEHGAGTLAFLIGLGYLDGNSLVLTQLILRDFEEERAQLSLFWDILSAFPYLVSFNGKSFDTSLLQSRLAFHRISSPEQSALKLRPHLDLLHLSRNTLKNTLPNMRLQTLEVELLQRQRHEDMPGSLAPACWFHWLRWQDPRPLAAIAEHNRLDVLSMVELAAHLASVSHLENAHLLDAGIWHNVFATYTRRRAYPEALRLLENPPSSLSPRERFDLYEQEAILARRCGHLTRAISAFECALNSPFCSSEHRERLEMALTRVQRALSRSNKSLS